MKINNIGNRGLLITFYELNGLPTNVYVIRANLNIFLVDTFLGPESMKPIKQRLLENFPRKKLIVLNTHYHWDHVWGNCAFPTSQIVSHTLCRETMLKYGEAELDKFSDYAQGDVELIYPNITFEQKAVFHEDGIEIFHTPGHTRGAISIYDKTDKVLIVGDNVEAPIPYLCNKDFPQYINSLERYLQIDFDTVIAGHCEVADRKLIEQNLQYIKDLKSGNTDKYDHDEFKQVHQANKKMMEEDK